MTPETNPASAVSVLDAARAVFSPLREDAEMARVRGRQKGYVWRQGPSWFGQFVEYRRDPDTGELTSERRTEYLGDAGLTKKEATAKLKPHIDRANAMAEKPSITMTVDSFLDRFFVPDVERTCKPGGKKHYRTMLKFIQPALGQRQLCDVKTADVQTLINRLARQYSRQVQLHVKNAVSAIFRLASDMDLYDAKNPAQAIRIGEITARKRDTYTTEQLAAVLVRLPSPVYEMALLGAECSLGPAELCGVRLAHCNFTAAVVERNGEILAPYSISIQENWYEGQRGSLKAGARRRMIPLGADLSELLEHIGAGRESDEPLFASRAGTPIDTHNIANRLFKRLRTELGFPVTWYGFRRCHSSPAALTGADLADRKLVMGHSKDAMTQYYDVKDVERMRGLTSRIEDKVKAEMEKARAKVVQIRRAG